MKIHMGQTIPYYYQDIRYVYIYMYICIYIYVYIYMYIYIYIPNIIVLYIIWVWYNSEIPRHPRHGTVGPIPKCWRCGWAPPMTGLGRMIDPPRRQVTGDKLRLEKSRVCGIKKKWFEAVKKLENYMLYFFTCFFFGWKLHGALTMKTEDLIIKNSASTRLMLSVLKNGGYPMVMC